MLNTRKNVLKTWRRKNGKNTEDSTNDLNMFMGKKFEELKTSVICDLTESMKRIIQTEIQGIPKGYKD